MLGERNKSFSLYLSKSKKGSLRTKGKLSSISSSWISIHEELCEYRVVIALCLNKESMRDSIDRDEIVYTTINCEKVSGFMAKERERKREKERRNKNNLYEKVATQWLYNSVSRSCFPNEQMFFNC